MFKAIGLDQRFHKNCVVRKSSPSLEEAKDQHFDLDFNCFKLMTMMAIDDNGWQLIEMDHNR